LEAVGIAMVFVIDGVSERYTIYHKLVAPLSSRVKDYWPQQDYREQRERSSFGWME
jgi:hypothetical protein